jgi:hypothetical protein
MGYWYPQFKWQLIEWFTSRGLLTKSKAERMTLRQLRGKYVEVRREMGR